MATKSPKAAKKNATTKSPDRAATVEAGDNSKRALADALNVLLADSYALYLKTKNFHWHVRGPHFRDYHLMFDDHAGQILGIADLIAERVRKLGFTTLRSIGHIAATQTVTDNEALAVPADAMLEELRLDTLAFIKSLKELKNLCERANDNATDGLVDDWTDQAEERAWFLAETLSKS